MVNGSWGFLKHKFNIMQLTPFPWKHKWRLFAYFFFVSLIILYIDTTNRTSVFNTNDFVVFDKDNTTWGFNINLTNLHDTVKREQLGNKIASLPWDYWSVPPNRYCYPTCIFISLIYENYYVLELPNYMCHILHIIVHWTEIYCGYCHKLSYNLPFAM